MGDVRKLSSPPATAAAGEDGSLAVQPGPSLPSPTSLRWEDERHGVVSLIPRYGGIG